MEEVNWKQDNMLEVVLGEPDDFLKVRETLSRIGVASRKERKLFQSCHILHKQGRYFIVHFKELFALDGKHANLTENDIFRRNTIAKLLSDWGLVQIVSSLREEELAPLSQIKVLSFKEKDEWTLETKYNIGKKKEDQELAVQWKISTCKHSVSLNSKTNVITEAWFDVLDSETVSSVEHTGQYSGSVKLDTSD